MKVSYSEDLASHTGPKSCVYFRKGVREALTGESAGWVLSRERGFASGCRRRQRVRKAKRNTSISQEVFRPRVVVDPMHAWKLSAREPGGPVSGRSGWCCGPRCESQGNTAAKNGYRESDRPIVAKKRGNACGAKGPDRKHVFVDTKGDPLEQSFHYGGTDS